MNPASPAIAPPDQYPWQWNRPPAFRLELAEFPVLMFPELSAALDAAGQKYLARHGITSEPATWQPPLVLASGLGLPGPEA